MSIDEYAALYRELKALQAKLKNARNDIHAGKIALIGDDYVATVQRRITLRPVVDAPVQPSNGAMKRPVPMQPMSHPMWQNREVE